MEKLEKKCVTILLILIIIVTSFSIFRFYPSETEDNIIVPHSYSVTLNSNVSFQCISVKEIIADYERGNITHLDITIGLLPGSIKLNLSDLTIDIRYVDKWGESHYDAYVLNGSKIFYNVKDLNIINVIDPDSVWDKTHITPNSSVTFRIHGNFGKSSTGYIKFMSAEGGTPIIVEINMPQFLTYPPLYTTFGGMVIINTTDVVNYSKPVGKDWVVDESLFLKDSVMVLNKNLTILMGGTFTMDNVTMKVEASNSTKYGIYVSEGAKMVITNSSISSTNKSDTDNHLYDINVFGNITLDNSDLSYSQGLNIYGGSATIENCSFYKNPLNVLYSKVNIECNRFTSCDEMKLIYDSSFIRDNIFENITYGISGFGEDFHFYSNIINNSDRSIFCSYRTSKIVGNQISNCTFGIYLESGMNLIIDNVLSQVNVFSQCSDCIINNNTLIDAGGIYVDRSDHMESGNYCIAIIDNNYISNSQGCGLCFVMTKAYCANNIIINSSRSDIDSERSNLVLFNNTLKSEVPTSIIARECTVSIINTTIDKCYVGMWMIDSTAVIINSTILNDASGKFEFRRETQEKCHLKIEDGSTVRMKDSTFDENEVLFSDYKSKLILPHKTIYKENPPLSWRFYANVALIVTTVAIITLSIWYYRRGKRKEKQNENTPK